jgi:hypothetical protein
MSKLWMSLWAVTDHWVVLVTGGGVTACLVVLQYWLQKTISWRIYKWVIVLFMAYACFLAWRDEYDRAQSLLATKADLEGQLRELRSHRGSEEQIRALEAELRLSQQALSALQHSLKPRRLAPEERAKFTTALAAYDGRPFGVIEVRTSLGCHECMMYRDDFVRAMNSVAGWTAQSAVDTAIRAGCHGVNHWRQRFDISAYWGGCPRRGTQSCGVTVVASFSASHSGAPRRLSQSRGEYAGRGCVWRTFLLLASVS